MIEGDAELLAGLHQPEHDVAGNATVDTDGAAGDLAPGDEGTNIVLRRVGVQWNIRVLENFEQFSLSSMEAQEQLVELGIAGTSGEYFVELAPKLGDQLRAGASPTSTASQHALSKVAASS